MSDCYSQNVTWLGEERTVACRIKAMVLSCAAVSMDPAACSQIPLLFKVSVWVHFAFHQLISQGVCHDALEKVLPDSIYTPAQPHCVWQKCTLRECVPWVQFIIEKETACLITWACTHSSQLGTELSFVLGFDLLFSLQCHASSHWSILEMSESIGCYFARHQVRINHEVRGPISSCRCQHNSVLLVTVTSRVQKYFQMCMVVGR